jgi:AbiV family abortive infection protein
VDLAAVKDALALVLARGSVAAARNACGLVQDAELLSGAGRIARAYSLAGLAVEEVGKAGSLATLAAMPENLRARAPIGRMLEWHQMKLVTVVVGVALNLYEHDALLRAARRAWATTPGLRANYRHHSPTSSDPPPRLQERSLSLSRIRVAVGEPFQFPVNTELGPSIAYLLSCLRYRYYRALHRRVNIDFAEESAVDEHNSRPYPRWTTI